MSANFKSVFLVGYLFFKLGVVMEGRFFDIEMIFAAACCNKYFRLAFRKSVNVGNNATILTCISARVH